MTKMKYNQISIKFWTRIHLFVHFCDFYWPKSFGKVHELQYQHMALRTYTAMAENVAGNNCVYPRNSNDSEFQRKFSNNMGWQFRNLWSGTFSFNWLGIWNWKSKIMKIQINQIHMGYKKHHLIIILVTEDERYQNSHHSSWHLHHSWQPHQRSQPDAPIWLLNLSANDTCHRCIFKFLHSTVLAVVAVAFLSSCIVQWRYSEVSV